MRTMIIEWMTKPIYEYNFIDVVLTFGVFVVVAICFIRKGE